MVASHHDTASTGVEYVPPHPCRRRLAPAGYHRHSKALAKSQVSRGSAKTRDSRPTAKRPVRLEPHRGGPTAHEPQRGRCARWRDYQAVLIRAEHTVDC